MACVCLWCLCGVPQGNIPVQHVHAQTKYTNTKVMVGNEFVVQSYLRATPSYVGQLI